MLGLQFLTEGARRSEQGLYFGFFENPAALRFKADASREPLVKPPFRVLTGWGFSADDRSRAIRALEQARLVEVHRRKGRPPLVRLLPWRGGAGG